MSLLNVVGDEIIYSAPLKQTEVYFVPYEDTLYRCMVCSQEFAAWQEDLLYRTVREVRKTKHYPTCHTPLWKSLTVQEQNSWRDKETMPLGERVINERLRTIGYLTITVNKEVLKTYLDLFSDWG